MLRRKRARARCVVLSEHSRHTSRRRLLRAWSITPRFDESALPQLLRCGLSVCAFATEDMHGSRAGNHFHRLPQPPSNVQFLSGHELDSLPFDNRDALARDHEDILVEVVSVLFRHPIRVARPERNLTAIGAIENVALDVV